MLVLTRKPGESIVIDGGINLDILHVNHHQVKIRFSRPVGSSWESDVLELESEEVFTPRSSVHITVCGTAPGRVRLGFEAPREIQIMREEVPR
ncbi:MAG TPA: carbon storage regulator [Solirubrobacterales bacterium]|nr:carbon storage regulator [Solirubrobacterales bacterium]